MVFQGSFTLEPSFENYHYKQFNKISLHNHTVWSCVTGTKYRCRYRPVCSKIRFAEAGSLQGLSWVGTVGGPPQADASSHPKVRVWQQGFRSLHKNRKTNYPVYIWPYKYIWGDLTTCGQLWSLSSRLVIIMFFKNGIYLDIIKFRNHLTD